MFELGIPPRKAAHVVKCRAAKWRRPQGKLGVPQA